MAIAPLMFDLQSKAAQATSLTVRHVGALVSMRVALQIENLARTTPIAQTTDAEIIAQALRAIRSGEPRTSSETSEQRWHLSFCGAQGKELVAVTSSIFEPRHGTIGGRTVLFASDALVRFLEERFAPDELGVGSA